ncbi:MAG: GYF domain-containing protein [Verrucomicrobiae bacterium]|nr:GYF domain-containing protein [Verrucomicrobiae bacterium]MDW7980287.1 GYF domain-containing protein [Verrucomicrobiales bacterium]
MYKVIGADGKEYGPVSAEQVRQWIAEGRANAETKGQIAGSAEWKPLREFAEFRDLFTAPPTITTQSTYAYAETAQAQALRKVKPPAICLLVTAVLYGCWALLDLAGRLILTRSEAWLERLSRGNPEMEPVVRLMWGPVGIAMDVWYLLLAVLVSLGAIRMMKLRSYGLAIASCIIVMLPCIVPCCMLGLPIGIWALVVLLQPEVRAQFT